MGSESGLSQGQGLPVGQDVVTTFEVRFKRCRVTLSRKLLTWEQEGAPYFRRHLPLEEIVAVDYQHDEGGACCKHDAWINGELHTQPRHNNFIIHHVQHVWKHRWKCQSISFYHPDFRLVTLWVAMLQNLLKANFSHRPRKLMVFVNPHGGKKKGEHWYNKIARPLFQLAGIDVKVVVTERANHAADMLQICQLDLDGVIAVGGDGMFAEVFNGLIFRIVREQKMDPMASDFALPQVPIRVGIIPCGSTDTVAYSIYGTNDVETAVLHVIMGESLGLDVCSIHSETTLLRLAVSMVSYGYFGDTLVESETLRWMGPKRYDYAGFKKVLKNSSYVGELEMLVDQESSPCNRTACCYRCSRCQEAWNRKLKNSQPKGEWRKVQGDFLAVSSFTMPCACKMSPKGVSPNAHLGDGCSDLVLVRKTSRVNYLRYLLRTAGDGASAFDLPYVETYRVREFRYRPLQNLREDFESGKSEPLLKKSSWNCDGEIITDPSIRVKVHCQPLRVFSRGVLTEEDHVKHCALCPCQGDKKT